MLVPLDGSPLSDDALAHALSLFDCPITVLNIVSPLDANMSEGRVIERGETREAAAYEHAEEILSTAKEQVSPEGQELEIVVKTGGPAETILEFVEEHDIDHIIMGAHGHDGGRIKRRLLGTVTTAVVGESPVTVTVVR